MSRAFWLLSILTVFSLTVSACSRTESVGKYPPMTDGSILADAPSQDPVCEALKLCTISSSSTCPGSMACTGTSDINTTSGVTVADRTCSSASVTCRATFCTAGGSQSGTFQCDGDITCRDEWGGGQAQCTGAPSPSCRPFGQPCASGGDCCSGLCDPATKTCVSSINKCTATGDACQSSTECCSLACSAGHCSATACLPDNQACSDPAACCSGTCTNGACQALNLACRTAGNACTDSAQCCSKLCQGGVCKLGASFCIQTGDVCSDSSTCCSGECKKGTGALGICAPPPSGATYCSDGVDGTVCDACNGCCSRVCAPYAPTGVHVCQPASGCRVNGDLCRKDSDCCGAAGTGLPGEGNVQCEIEVGKTVGICRNPKSCNPQGNVCHYKDYTCSISSARNDCCGAVGNSGVCQLDSFGVPRCNGLGTTCRQGGETCASMADCCDHAPCVPDAKGILHCYGATGVDGGTTSKCVPLGGTCSINGDCCVGTTCIQPIGSTQGVCGIPTLPPGPTPGLDAGTPDSSQPGCAQYGQTCTTAAECCNQVPCTDGRCVDIIR